MTSLWSMFSAQWYARSPALLDASSLAPRLSSTSMPSIQPS